MREELSFKESEYEVRDGAEPALEHFFEES
jgi:hypothetical protein